MKLTLIGAALLFVGGCTVTTTTDHTLESGSFSVPAGYCGLVSGPFYLPSGAINSYTLQDNGGYDLMDVTVVDDSFGNCDFTFDGYPYSDVFLSSSFFSGSTGEVQSGFYDFWARCNNSVADCQFSLDWTANY